MPEDHQNELPLTKPLPDWLQKQVLGDTPIPNKSEGVSEAPAAFPDREPKKKKTGEF